jgi:DNA-binding CsgD family transcriptional regulator/uncharacterized glyoxalase superfamily protein PhnB
VTASPFGRIGRPRHADVLTPAEWEVLAGVRDGFSNREIATSRGCDLETVRFHLRNVRRKLGVQGRQELRAFPGRPATELQQAPAERRIREQIPLIHVRDMGRSLEFYVSTLGFEIVSRWPDDQNLPGWVALGSGGARIMLRTGHPRRKIDHGHRGGTTTLSLYVEGLDAFRRDLIDAGYRCGEPEALFYGAREFYLLDPDGNELAIVEFAASEPVYLATRKRRKQ